jgi:hypothetical protein
MGFFSEVKKAAKETVKATVKVATLGQDDKIKDVLQSEEFEDLALLTTTGGLGNIAKNQKEKRDAREDRAASAEASLKEDQQALRQIEFDRAVDTQTETAQLAQRELFRENQRQQATLQASQAASGFTSSAQAQLSSSLATNTAAELGSLQGDLEGNLDFLQDTFDLGGSIGAASQQLADLQADAQKEQQQLAGFASSVGTGAAIGGVPGAAVGGGLFVLNEIFG